MILLAEPVHFSEVHLQVNTAFIALYRQIYEGEVRVYAEERHIQAIRRRGASRVEGLSFTGFRAYGRSGIWYWPGKIWGEWRQVLKIVRLARKQKPELLVWLCLFPTGHLFLQLLSRLLLPGQEQLIILHGEMEYLGTGAGSKRSDRFLAAVLRKALAWAPALSRYLVLGSNIPDRLEQAGIFITAPVLALDHPFLYDNDPPVKKRSSGLPLQICTFGTLKRSKNAHLFFELAARFRQEIAQGLIRFRAIGKMFPDMDGCPVDCVECYGSGDFLPQEDYERQLKGNDLALFFYERDTYRFSASGVCHEAWNQQLPVWSLYNNYFADLFRRYPAGRCFDRLDELESALRHLLAEEQYSSKLNEYYNHLVMFFHENTFLLQAGRLRSVTGMARTR